MGKEEGREEEPRRGTWKVLISQLTEQAQLGYDSFLPNGEVTERPKVLAC